jgi:hypothetical protein
VSEWVSEWGHYSLLLSHSSSLLSLSGTGLRSALRQIRSLLEWVAVQEEEVERPSMII